MHATEWLFLLLDGAPEGLEPVRVHKALFLLAREGGIPPDEAYTFVPYNFGPMSRGLYADADILEASGLLLREIPPGRRHPVWRLTPAGRERARWSARRAAHAAPTAVQALDRLRDEVTSRTFAELLDHIYARYPEYASRSVFRRYPT